MSYNTRRNTTTVRGQGPVGRGISRGATQVMYQPRPSNPPRIGPTPVQSTPAPGYNSQQNIKTVTGFASQTNSQSYNAQPVSQAPPAPVAPVPSTTLNQTPTVPQYQAQTAPSQVITPEVQIKKEVVQPPQENIVPKEDTTTTTTTTTTTPTNMEVPSDEAVDGDEVKPKPWLKRKAPGFKVNKKLKRRRQNARLRKIVQPKNAIMVLNELKTGIKFTFQEHTNALTQTMFIVNAEVDGKTFVGQGTSKPVAKQNAAENALKALLLEKMCRAKIGGDETSEDMPALPSANSSNDVTMENAGSEADVDADGDDEMLDGTKPAAPEDDVPWGSLASFAMYKLFTDWQSQGTHVPVTKPAVAPPKPGVPASPIFVKAGATPSPMKKIPDNPTERHPVMLLNQLRPGVQFSEICREGTTPNLTFTLGVVVDGVTYTGVAKNKKDSKKAAAKAALSGALGIVYE